MENLGCESVSTATALTESSPRYVLVLTSTLRHCSEALFSFMTKDHFDYVFGDVPTLFSELKVPEKDSELIRRELKGSRLSGLVPYCSNKAKKLQFT